MSCDEIGSAVQNFGALSLTTAASTCKATEDTRAGFEKLTVMAFDIARRQPVAKRRLNATLRRLRCEKCPPISNFENDRELELIFGSRAAFCNERRRTYILMKKLMLGDSQFEKFVDGVRRRCRLNGKPADSWQNCGFDESQDASQ